MNILSVENISKSYGEKPLFSAASFGIDENDKIGLLGINGTGKSTLLKLIAGYDSPESGSITRGNQVTIEYLPQNPYMDTEATVLQQVFKGTSPIMQLLSDYERTVNQLTAISDDKLLQSQLIKLSEQMDALDTWHLESDAKAVLTQLGIYQFDAKVSTLSGGQKKRIALAGALITPADLLVLDEPTNHIDNAAIDWLEQYLKRRKGALIMVTHDRYFLDRVVDKIFELDQGSFYSYNGNYSYYLQTKLEREEQAQVSEKKRERLLRKELEWIRKGARARTTKQKARIQRYEQLSETPSRLPDNKLELGAVSSRLGKQIIELDHITKSFTSEVLISDFNYILLRDDRIGVIGPNGIGKSTLLNIIAGKIPPDLGKVIQGKTVKIGYFTQETPDFASNQRAIDYMKEVAEYLPLADGSTITAAQMLERFLIPGELQWVNMNRLSGGEKRRLYLARILMEAPNVLVLDEPTNDLDIATLTILEDYLDDFMGAVIIASHDRYFLDRTTTKTFYHRGRGQIDIYPGNYSDNLETVNEIMDSAVAGTTLTSGDKVAELSKIKPADTPRKKFTFKEQREYDQIDDLIALKENELQLLNTEIDDASSDFTRLQKLLSQQQQLQTELEQMIERWTYLNELAETISKNN